MHEIINVERDYALKQIISVFERPDVGDNVPLSHYLEVHEVQLVGRGERKGIIIGPGRPLTEASVFGLSRSLTARTKEQVKRAGIIPPGLLYSDPDKQVTVWYKPEHRSYIRFAKELNLKDQNILHPGLVFRAQGENLFVYAADLKKGAHENTPLFHAPYLNLHDDHNICKGSANIQPVTRAESFADLIGAWEGVFFLSKFSSGTGLDIPHRTKNTNAQYLTLMKRSKTFPYNTLYPLKHPIKWLFR